MVWWAPPTALPASFVTRTPARAVQQQGSGKTYPEKRRKSKRERTKGRQLCMREKKRKKTKGKSRLLLDSHKKLHQRPVKKWTGRQNVSPLLLIIIITSHYYYYYCCRCTSASNTSAALLLACLLAAASLIAFVSSDRAPVVSWICKYFSFFFPAFHFLLWSNLSVD